MLLINKLAAPGEIRRVELGVELIKVTTRNGEERLYRLVPATSKKSEIGVNQGGIDKHIG